jgi:aspartokinase-like uncharacterized kinase
MITPRLRWSAALPRLSPSPGRHAAVIFPYRALRYRPLMPHLDLQRLTMASLAVIVAVAVLFTSVAASGPTT